MCNLSQNEAKMVPKVVPEASRSAKITDKFTVRDQNRFAPTTSPHFHQKRVPEGAQGFPKGEPKLVKIVKKMLRFFG